jgi:F0F1-type ATP synthase assembly protein I
MSSQPPVPREPRKSGTSPTMQVAAAMEMPFILVASVVIGGGLGYLADRSFHTSPTFTLILGVLGFAGGLWDIIKRLSRDTGGSGGAQ